MKKGRVDTRNTNPKYWEEILEKSGLGLRRLEIQEEDEIGPASVAEATSGHRVIEGNKDFAQLRTRLDSNDSFISGGHEIKKLRAGRPDRTVFSWTMSDSAVQRLLLRSFPKLETSQAHRKYAGRWARIIHLFYRIGMSRTQVAKEMGLDAGVVKDALRSIKRASRGLRANNTRLRVHPTPPLV